MSAAAMNGPRLDPQFWQSTLRNLEREPEPLLTHLGNAGGGRLGLYFERLWHFLLQHDPHTQLLAHNLPIRENGRTLGEFDCLYYCYQRQQPIHLELAVKFYLAVPGHDYWLGPGGRDRLDIKLEHLLQRQMKLSQVPAARTPLAALGVTTPCCEALIKGYLFAPYPGYTAPPLYHPQNQLSLWYTLPEFAARTASTPSANHSADSTVAGWLRLPRARWLSPYQGDNARLCDAAEIQRELEQHFQQSAQPALVAACNADASEQWRCFVTPAAWPGNTQADGA
jgi:hypothetical protein